MEGMPHWIKWICCLFIFSQLMQFAKNKNKYKYNKLNINIAKPPPPPGPNYLCILKKLRDYYHNKITSMTINILFKISMIIDIINPK